MKTEKTTKRKYFVGNKKLKNVKMFEEFLNEAKKPSKKDIAFAQVIFDAGDQIDDWAIDVNPETGEQESNGGKEFLVHVKDIQDIHSIAKTVPKSADNEFYLVQTNWNDEPFTASILDPDKLDDDDSMFDTIKKYRAANK